MIYEIYSVKDIISGCFSDIKLFNNSAVAERWFRGLISESKIGGDLQLFRLGTFNIESGEIAFKLEFFGGGEV